MKQVAARHAIPDNLRRFTIPVWAIPALVALVLSSNGFQFPFLWDDYDFLGRAQTFSLRQLLPDPATIFYRPLSREIYFGVVYALGATGALWGHILNVVLLIAATILLTGLVSRLSGVRAGFLSGLVFACFSQVPLLAAFICTVQDLMALVFILLALHLRLARRPILALLALAAAILSKETALAAVPVLIAFDWVLGRRPYKLGINVVAYGALTAAWAGIHPGIQSLLANRMQRTVGGYVGPRQSGAPGIVGEEHRHAPEPSA